MATKIIALAIIVASFALGIYFYPQLPETVASHWDSAGQVNGYLNRFWGAFLMPIIILAMFLLFLIIPKIDPLSENIKKFRRYFDWLIVLIMVFMVYVYLLSVLWNLGKEFNLSQFLIPAFGLLFFYMGVLVENAQRNWSIGIRTPWTLSSDEIWNKTHQIGGKLFKISGIITLLGIVFPLWAMWLVLAPIIASSVFLFVYSYLQYKKWKK
jgi:uncharacterized membrane protein